MNYNLFSSLWNYKERGENMKEVFETVWDEYFFEKCAEMDTDEERRLAKKTVEFHEAASSLLNERYLVSLSLDICSQPYDLCFPCV